MQPSKKTLKRELAVILFVPLFYLAMVDKDVEMVKAFVWPTFSFAALAFGLDWHGRMQQNKPS